MAFVEYKGIDPIDIDERQFIKTGVMKLDKQILGFQKGAVTVITGLAGCGKSTFLGNIICEFTQQHQYGLICSLEMSNARLQNWLNIQWLGKHYIEKTTTSVGKVLYSPQTRELQDKAQNDLSDYIKVYDNTDFSIERILNDISQQIREGQCVDYVVLDNIMKLDYDNDNDKYLSQSSMIKKIQIIAQTYNIAFILVAHPKKIKTLLRIEDVGGSGDIVNIADLVLLLHRVTWDFKIKACEYFGWDINTSFESGFNVLIEIAKSREFGEAEGHMIGQFYEEETRRFLNYKKEDKRFFRPKPIYGQNRSEE